MEFSLTPVPGSVTRRGNIYQTTKLVTDPDYVDKLKQFDKNIKSGMLQRKGRFIEGVFVESENLQYVLEDENVYSAVGLNGLKSAISQRSLRSNLQKLRSAKQIKALSQLTNIKNHQAFWVHGSKNFEERDKLQVNNSPKASNLPTSQQNFTDQAKPDDYFAKPNSKMTHVKSYIMVRGKLIPSINYKAKQPIYNRFKIEDENNKSMTNKSKYQSAQELITFPAVDGPLKLPNIGFSNEINSNQYRTIENKNKIETKANLELKIPKGKKNLQTYIKTLQAKQNLVDLQAKSAIAEERNKQYYVRDISLNDEDPRSLKDMLDENKDLEEQFMFQLKNLQSYAKVANIWWQENRGDGINPYETFRGSFQGENGSLYGESMFYGRNNQSSNPANFIHYPELVTAVKYKAKDTNLSVNDLTVAETGISPSVNNPNNSMIDSISVHSNVQSVGILKEQLNQNQYQFSQTHKNTSLLPQKSQLTIPNSMIKKISFINKKVKSFFFGNIPIKQEQKDSEEEEEKPDIEVPADFKIPEFKTQSKEQKEEEKILKKISKTRSLNMIERPKLQSIVKASQFDYKIKLQLEIEKMRDQLQTQYRNLRLVDIENKIRDNKRNIINLLTENIFQLRFGIKEKKEKPLSESDQIFLRVLQKREDLTQNVKLLYQKAQERNVELSQWLIHSQTISAMQKIRILSDIVVLAQEKNLLDEFYGIPEFIKVGVIEAELNYPLRIAEKYGSMQDNDYFSRRMRIQFDEFLACLNAIELDIKEHSEINEAMIEFVSEIIGHKAWVQVALHRGLRRKQLKQQREFDPDPLNIIPVFQSKYTAQGKAVLTQSTAEKQIENQVPISSVDQFGTLERFLPMPQFVSRPIQQTLKLYTIQTQRGKSSKNQDLKQHKEQQMRLKLLMDEYWQPGSQAFEEDNRTPQKNLDNKQRLDTGLYIKNQDVENNILKALAQTEIQALESQFDDESMSRYNMKQNIITNFHLKSKLEQEEKEREENYALQRLKEDLERIKKEQKNRVLEEKIKDLDTREPKKEDTKLEVKPFKARWLDKLNQEKIDKKEKEERDKKERQEKLKQLLGDDNEDDLLVQDKYQNLAGEGLFDYLQKIDNHLKAEQNIIVAWQGNDSEKRIS